MSWISENKIPAAIIGVSAAAAVALGVVAYNAYSSYSDSMDKFHSLNQGIAALKGAPLAPTPENVARKTQLVTDYAAEADKLSFVLHKLQTPDTPISDTAFQAKLKAKISAIRKLAADHRVALPAEFNLAFDKYTAELPKSNDIATQLSSYLDAVDALVQLMINSGVLRLDLLERSDLPSEKPAAPAPKAPPKAAPSNKKGAKGPAVPVAPKAAPVTERYQLRAVVTTDQGPLQLLIGWLASPSETPGMPYFPIVRVLRIENERQEGPPVQAALPPPPPPPPPPPNGPPPAPPDSVTILGNEKLKVFLEIDLVKFL